MFIIGLLNGFELTEAGIPPTKIRFGTSVPNFGALFDAPSPTHVEGDCEGDPADSTPKLILLFMVAEPLAYVNEDFIYK